MSSGEVVYVVRLIQDGPPTYLSQIESHGVTIDRRMAARRLTAGAAEALIRNRYCEGKARVVPLRVRVVEKPRCPTCGARKKGGA